jgi:hypothetical protein
LFVLSEDSPAREASNDQDACGDSEQRLFASRSMGRLKLQEIKVAGTARTQVIEPLVRFGKRHFARGDSFENVSPWAPNAARIWELFNQTAAQGIQDAPLVAC